MSTTSGREPKHRQLRSWALGGALVLGLALFALLVVQTLNPRSPSPSVPPTADATQSVASISLTRQAPEQLDPHEDGWASEAVADTAKHALLELLENNDSAGEAIDESFRGTDLRPPVAVAYEEGDVVVRRQSGEAGFAHDGREGWTAARQQLMAAFAPNVPTVHVKVIRVDATEEGVVTDAFVELSGDGDSKRLEQHGRWHCQWTRSDDQNLTLQSVVVSEFSEVAAPGVWFHDVTGAAIAANSAWGMQLRGGLNHWLTRVERAAGMHVFARWGLAVGDVNGDGREDLYLCQPGGLPNRLLLHQPDGSVSLAPKSGCEWLDPTSSALLVDLDNDADADLVLAMSSGVLVMENDGQGHFESRCHLETQDRDTQSLSAVDFDNDGLLDLYLCIDFARSGRSENAFVYHDANDGGQNRLFRNEIGNDDWQFTDVTADVGLDVHNRRHSLAASWADFDNDGDQDLYVANDYGQNCLYRNEGGRFEEVASELGVVDFGSGMSVSWGDFDRDGWLDLYVGNMFSSAGNRITHQQQFRQADDPTTRATYQRFAKGNSLFRNAGGQFDELSETAGVELGRWAWSSLFTDINNDGWQDLLVANGYITTPDTGDL